jgi:hypothetical protein
MLHANARAKAVCYNCHTELAYEAGSNVLRTEQCPKCEVELRCCANCKFYDPQSYNECREPTAERLTEKKKANYCEFFALMADPEKEKEDQNKILNAAKSLFKD